MKTKYSKNFLKDAKFLRKKYQKFDSDLLKFINSLEKESFIAASRIQGLDSLEIYKARLRNSSSLTGKSGGFRVVYYAKISENCFYLLSIYSKSEKLDISKKEILQILKSENLIK
jgi:mRNA-degrading endonuclease RelE of RelBE toxin-antitoxin system